ncbi:MAG TPA: HD domain-containing protein [Sedimentisphaerales bacterium]|nr:HD domain-containing protein [Sedimentisphaerales bacterium]
MPRVFDAVYGYIELSDLEFRLVTSPIFQRLHWIKQLGPLNTVFPSAQHSRFSHAVGVYHIVKKMIELLKKKRPREYQYRFRDDDEQALKLAALLHDVGHVPLSHIGEEVLKKTFAKKIQERAIEAFDQKKPASWRALFPQDYLGAFTKLHEALSAEIVLHNSEIDTILQNEQEGWPDEAHRRRVKETIARIIVGKDSSDIPTLLLHSELDADRLDFLLRDSFFTGVDYGKIDLHYIISRLAVVRKKNDPVPYLCVEKKGLHTVEHYILGRFFLQTQIIYNRRVRLMDLLCADVMEYMVENRGAEWQLMDLEVLVGHIRGAAKGQRERLHEIYAFTDAQVVSKMRKLHEELDKKEKGGAANEDECYINDCIKVIMDGQVADPAAGDQKVVDLADRMGEGFEKRTRIEAEKIAAQVAKELGVYPRRVKVNVVSEETMKYKPREDEERNREAVKITYKSTAEKDEIMPAVCSNASILRGLADKALVIFNVYYIPHKPEFAPEIRDKEDKIREAYRQLFSQYFESQTLGCGCETGRHMCQILRETGGLEQVRKLSTGAKYICEKCGRVSSDADYLCAGIGI